MKEIYTKVSGSVTPDDNSPVIVPSFNNGGATATQSGYVITVTCVNNHNISTLGIDGISDQNVRVYLRFANVLPTGTYGNIIVISTKIFTCVASISQTISTPVAISHFGSGTYSLSSLGMNFLPNELISGCSIRTEAMIFFPTTGVASRSQRYGLGTTTAQFVFSTVSLTANTNSALFYCITQFLSNTDYITLSGGIPVASNQLITRINAVNLSTSGLTLVPSISFGTPPTNDYQLWVMIRAEVAQ